MNEKNNKVYKIALTGLMAALSYVVFTFLQIKITLPGGDATSIHLVMLSAFWVLCFLAAYMAAWASMTIGDLLDPVYIVYAPKTFLLKFCIGLITGLIAHKFGKVSTSMITNTY